VVVMFDSQSKGRGFNSRPVHYPTCERKAQRFLLNYGKGRPTFISVPYKNSRVLEL